MKQDRILTFTDAINEALDITMTVNQRVILMGLGVPDGPQTYGSTSGLIKKHGNNRVYDSPVSEASLTGVAVGASLVGMRPVIFHSRFEFAMLSIDQIVNQAAKWNYMTGGAVSCPITVCMVVGRGWGQGAQHSQSLHNWFAHIPGLKVVMPATPHDAKGLLISSIMDSNPVVFIVHRWLCNSKGIVPSGYYTTPLESPSLLHEGNDVTIVASSFMTFEAIDACKNLKEQNINVDLIDLRTINPFNDSLIIKSVSKTGRLVVCDHATYTASFAAEVIARTTEKCLHKLKSPPVRVTLPDCPTPSTRALANHYYPTVYHIEDAVKKTMGITCDPKPKIITEQESYLDVRDTLFSGPL